MNPIAQAQYLRTPDLSRLNNDARRERARAIGRLVGRLLRHLSPPRPSHTWMARWG